MPDDDRPTPTAAPQRRPVRFKVCGLTRVEDAEAAVEAGAWAAGIILVKGSPRRATLAEAAAIAGTLRRRALVVGVFVNERLDDVVRTVDMAGLTAVQLHGDEGPSFASEVARRTGVKVIKAARIGARADVQALDAFRGLDFHLMDAAGASDGPRGGTGRTFDWSLARTRRSTVPLLLAGGLGPENVGEAILEGRPWGVDVSSGVEASPGVKDHEQVEAFIAAVRATAEPDGGEEPSAVPDAEPAEQGAQA